MISKMEILTILFLSILVRILVCEVGATKCISSNFNHCVYATNEWRI